jgi:hypothetical protein
MIRPDLHGKLKIPQRSGLSVLERLHTEKYQLVPVLWVETGDGSPVKLDSGCSTVS